MGTVYHKHVLVFTILTDTFFEYQKYAYYLYCSCLLCLTINLRHKKRERIQYVYLLRIENHTISKRPEALHPRFQPQNWLLMFSEWFIPYFYRFLWLSSINAISFSSLLWQMWPPSVVLQTLSLLHVCFSSIWTDNTLYPQIISYSLPTVWGTKGQMWPHWPSQTACLSLLDEDTKDSWIYCHTQIIVLLTLPTVQLTT